MAIAVYQQILGEDLGYFMAHTRLARLYRNVREAVAMNGRDLGTQYVLGVILAKSGQTAEARVAQERFLTFAPHSLYQAQLTDAKQRLAALPP